MLHRAFMSSKLIGRELVFQLALFGIVFIFYIYRHERGVGEFRIEPHTIWFFLNYTWAVCVINYGLLPKFLYTKRYTAFIVGVVLVVGVVMAIEEGVIEKIYFPLTRGAHFPGVFFNLAGILPIIAILSGFKFAWDALAKQKELDELQALVKESELQFLKSQINPHFLFNNLNNLYAYALEKSPKTPEIILELSSVLRYMLYECREKYVPLNQEIEQLKNFIQLSKLQMEERGDISVDISIKNQTYVIAPLILTVFVENAFKHSLSSQSDNIQIRISASLTDEGVLHFSCRNTFSQASNTESLASGIGLENVSKRLAMLYPDAHELKTKQEANQYIVELTLQLHQP